MDSEARFKIAKLAEGEWNYVDPICDDEYCINSARYSVWWQGAISYACGKHLSVWFRILPAQTDAAIVRRLW